MKQDIMEICIDAGMTEEEFFTKMRLCYASYVAAQLDENLQNVVVHTAIFPDGNIVIESRRLPGNKKNTIN
ncbi:hypothetical protein [Nitrosomonas supralitoralis]|nr:hypothetical protein [Nitrosomonas supralitoralis]